MNIDDLKTAAKWLALILGIKLSEVCVALSNAKEISIWRS